MVLFTDKAVIRRTRIKNVPVDITVTMCAFVTTVGLLLIDYLFAVVLLFQFPIIFSTNNGSESYFIFIGLFYIMLHQSFVKPKKLTKLVQGSVTQ